MSTEDPENYVCSVISLRLSQIVMVLMNDVARLVVDSYVTGIARLGFTYSRVACKCLDIVYLGDTYGI